MTPWVIGNWKLNPASRGEAQTLIDNIISEFKGSALACNLMVAPSYVHLNCVGDTINSSSIPADTVKLASQDVTYLTESSGAFTGDVSVAQLKDLGVSWVIIGHSERRQYHNENQKTLQQKLTHCIENELGVVLCIGETEAEFDNGQTQAVLSEQLAVIKSFVAANGRDVAISKLSNVIIAYEPVWAIGTGKVPSVKEVESIHDFIRSYLSTVHDTLKNTPIIYGGSVKPNNADDFASCHSINGVLVGGAALDSHSFISIAKSFAK